MADRSPNTYTKGSDPVWFRRNNKAFASPYTPPSTPTSHRRTIPATPILGDMIAEDVDWLDASAADDEARADALLRRADRKRALAAAYRALIVAPEPQPVAAAPQIPAEPDPSQFNPTWQLPQEPGMCGCRHAYGESCALCDASVSEGLSILTPWTPDAHDTAAYPLVNGWTR